MESGFTWGSAAMEDFDLVSKTVRFTRKEVEDLALKLASAASKLSESEQDLLLAVFSAAADHVTVPGDPYEPSGKDLREQIVHAFIADKMGLDEKELLISCRIGSGPPIHG
jgi:hypothetical protein